MYGTGMTVNAGDVTVKSIVSTNGMTIASSGLKISTGLTITSAGVITTAGSISASTSNSLNG